MPLTPDEIANRAFTPSAEGYHQAEVREFLARIAAERSALLASRPEGQAEAAEVTVALNGHEQRLQALERRLANTAAELAAIAEALRANHDRASQQLAAARKLTADQQALVTSLAARSQPRGSGLASGAGGPGASVPATPAWPPQPITAEPRAPEANRSIPPLPPTAPPRTTPPRTTPAQTTPAPQTSAPARTEPAASASASMTSAALDPDGPLISDNANQLLDDVLDDVLGNINERPRP